MPPTPDDFTDLYRRHAQSLLVYFQRRVRDPEAAADLLAETFELAIRNGPAFRGAGEAELSGWLWAIARSALGNHARRLHSEQRRARRLGRQRITLADRELERIEELAAMADLRDAVAQRLAQLPPEQREAVRLRVLEDVPYEEIARRVNARPETVRARVSRGLKTLNLALLDNHRAWREG